MSLSKKQKDFAINRLKSQFQQVKLKCDGYEVALRLVQVTDSRLAVQIYVNDYFKGVWLTKPEEYEESKFLPVRIKSLYSPKEKKEILKKFGKRNAYKYFPNLDEKLEHKFTHFSSGRVALTHLIKISDSIELLGEMTA